MRGEGKREGVRDEIVLTKAINFLHNVKCSARHKIRTVRGIPPWQLLLAIFSAVAWGCDSSPCDACDGGGSGKPFSLPPCA